MSNYLADISAGFGRRFKKNIPLFAALVLFIAVGIFLFIQAIFDPNVYLLVPRGGAEWICFPEQVEVRSLSPGEVTTTFRKRFRIDQAPDAAFLEVRAFRAGMVALDGQTILGPKSDMDSWKESRLVDLAPGLRPGEHEIIVMVKNRNAFPALLAYCPEIGLRTGPGWEASNEPNDWKPAISVDRVIPPPINRQFQRADKALLSRLPYLLPVFILVFSLTFWWSRVGVSLPLINKFLGAGNIRWVLIAALGILGINNAMKLSVDYGFDVVGHLKYILYIVEEHRLPLATEGWMMFHPPLYYLISAPFYVIFSKFFDEVTVVKTLRLIPIACGVLQVELCYRAARYVFPERGDLQAIGPILGGLVAMNIYSSQVVGNETPAGFLTSVILVMCFSLIRHGGSRPRWYLPVLGLVLGLAILTKMTAIMLIPPIFLLLLHLLYTGEKPARRAASAIVTVFAIAVAISGWFYLRNRLSLGTSNIGDWSQSVYLDYWQYPGCRTTAQLYRFGTALLWPFFSGVYGLWDAVYSTCWTDGYLSSAAYYHIRPPWNDNFLLSIVLLSILPCIAIIVGFFRTLLKPAESMENGALFATLVTTVYFAGFVYHFLKVPFYSGVKSTYMMGLLPCLAVLGANGFELFTRRPVFRAFFYGWLACWATAAYCAFFIL